MVCTLDPWEIELSNGSMTIVVEANKATISTLKGIGVDLVALPSEALHTVQDGVITKLRA